MSTPVELAVRGGHHFTILLDDNSGALRQLASLSRRLREGKPPSHNEILQLPLRSGQESLCIHTADILKIRLPNHGEHRAMNTCEGHLGGYISARHPQSVEMGMAHGDSATWAPDLWQWIVENFGVSSVLDVGCGEGHAAGFFASLGCRITGVDGSALALRDSFIPEHHRQHDYTQGPFLPDERYELVWCCEFVEHVEACYVDNFLATFDSASRFIFMTAAPPGQVGWHHVNCQNKSYWIEKIELRGFKFSQALTDQAKARAGGGHFANQGMVFIRPEEPVSPSPQAAQ